MKVRALVGAGLIAAVGVGVLAPVADAANTTEVTFTLTNNGGLSVSVDEAGGAGKDLGEIDAAADDTVAGDLRATTVTDSRNSTAGWVVSAQSTDFNISGAPVDNAIPAANVTIAIPATQAIDILIRGGLESADGVFVPDVDGTPGTGGAIGTLTSTGLGNLLGGLLGGVLGGSSNHSVTYTPTASIVVPSDRTAGVYTGTITQTAV